MKKISILMSLLAMFCMTFTSCKEDTYPRLDKPTKFVLNEPAMIHNLYELTQNGEVHFTVSQADYGLGVTPLYQVEVSKTEDFAEFQAVEGTTTDAKITVLGEDFALAICKAFGYESKDTFDGSVRPVYVRVHSFVPNAEYSSIRSNVICLEKVKPYFAVKLPDKIFLVGQPSGWDINSDAMTLTETEYGSKLYMGEFEIPEGQFQFRFYDELGDWDYNSIGAQDEDNPVEIAFDENGLYEGNCKYDPATKGAGKGAWQVSSWTGGTVKMTVDLAKKKIVFEKVQ